METIRAEQLRTLDRVGHFLAKLEASTDPFEIEALLEIVARESSRSYARVRAENAASIQITVPAGAAR